MRARIPCRFVPLPEALMVSRQQAREMLGGMKETAFWQVCHEHNVRALTGGVFSVAELKRMERAEVKLRAPQ